MGVVIQWSIYYIPLPLLGQHSLSTTVLCATRALALIYKVGTQLAQHLFIVECDHSVPVGANTDLSRSFRHKDGNRVL